MTERLRVLVIINDVQKLKSTQSTAEIMQALPNRGHEAYVASVSDLGWG